MECKDCSRTNERVSKKVYTVRLKGDRYQAEIRERWIGWRLKRHYLVFKSSEFWVMILKVVGRLNKFEDVLNLNNIM